MQPVENRQSFVVGGLSHKGQWSNLSELTRNVANLQMNDLEHDLVQVSSGLPEGVLMAASRELNRIQTQHSGTLSGY